MFRKTLALIAVVALALVVFPGTSASAATARYQPVIPGTICSVDKPSSSWGPYAIASSDDKVKKTKKVKKRKGVTTITTITADSRGRISKKVVKKTKKSTTVTYTVYSTKKNDRGNLIGLPIGC